MVELVLATILCASTTIGVAYADVEVSPNYEFVNTDLGGGGLVPSSSPNYQSALSVGDAAVGGSSSTHYQLAAGSQTTADPYLSVSITQGSGSFGLFTPTAASVTTTQFAVEDYTSYGYAVQIEGSPPSYGGHVITAMATNGTSSPGTNQFGINLVANTSPVVGANPNNGQFGQGLAATNYNTPNSFRYVSGETIATAPKSSGLTIYTISYLVNIASLMPGGQYVSNQQIVCTATY